MGTAKKLLDTAHIARRGLQERRVPYWSSSKLARAQSGRVRAIVRHAYETVPFYRRTMDERGLRPEDFETANDLTRLPVVDGRTLQ